MSQTNSPLESSWKRTLLLWVLSVLITLSSVVYQRLTGPTWPVRGETALNGYPVSFRLPTSHETSADALVKIEVAPPIGGEFRWRRINSDDPWHSRPLARDGDVVLARIPAQPAAGKVAYRILLTDGNDWFELTPEPVVIRFKDPVPAGVLIPHIVAMFTAMMLGTRTGVGAVFRENGLHRKAVWTSVLLLIGGLILGPIVQKYAFGAFWTGWPFGHDMTDNKTAVAMIFWLIALWRGRKEGRGRGWYITAAAVHLLVYLIPHSLFGSELDYTQPQSG